MKNEDRYLSKDEKKRIVENKKLVKRELSILKYMLKTDVIYYHHNREDSSIADIKEAIDKVKNRNSYEEYNSYIWNYQGEGFNYMSVSNLGNIFKSDEFENIYGVPLDGTYIFSIYDSGHRGLGSFNIITATKVESKLSVPQVKPGALIPETVNYR